MVEQRRETGKPAQAESGPRVEIARAVRDLLKQTCRIAEAGLRDIDDGQRQVDPDELTDAFLSIEQIGHAGFEILKDRGSLIFPGDRVTPETARQEAGVVTKEEKPKTFAELLRIRIDEALPEGKDDFRRDELREFLQNNRGTSRAIVAAGFSKSRYRFSRDQATQIIWRYLTTSRRRFVVRESYDRNQVRTTFFLGNVKLLNELSAIVGHDWSRQQTVDYQTAMQLRGLALLEGITAKHPG